MKDVVRIGLDKNNNNFISNNRINGIGEDIKKSNEEVKNLIEKTNDNAVQSFNQMDIIPSEHDMNRGYHVSSR